MSADLHAALCDLGRSIRSVVEPPLARIVRWLTRLLPG